MIIAACAVTCTVESDDYFCDNDDDLPICPSMNNFDAEFPSIVDHVLPESEPFFFTTTTNFFRNIMNFNDTEIEQVMNFIIAFFRTNLGVDFSSAPPDANGTQFLASIYQCYFHSLRTQPSPWLQHHIQSVDS